MSLAATTAIAPEACAQIQKTTLNLYVCPSWGDDQEATSRLLQMIQDHAILPPSQWATNFPIPFRTINGQGPTHPYLGAIPTLAVNGTALSNYFERFVIHLLPGLYALAGSCSGSGQRSNDEVFPIVLHEKISLQGTSALDTILDNTGYWGPVIRCRDFPPFVFDQGGTLVNSQWHTSYLTGARQSLGEVFVDGVTIRGAKVPTQPSCPGTIAQTNPGEAAAGVYFFSENAALRPTFSNCFITDNRAGVVIVGKNKAVNPHVPGNKEFISHEPVFLNNTFYDNETGFFDADDQSQSQAQPPESFGRSRSHLVNNLFDSSFRDLAGVDLGLVTATEYQLGAWVPFGQNGGYVNAFTNGKVEMSGTTVGTNAFVNSLSQCPDFRAIVTTTRPGRRPQQPPGSKLEFSTWTLGSPPSNLFYVFERIQPLDPSTGAHDLRMPLLVDQGGMLTLNPLIDQGIVPGTGTAPTAFRRRVVDPDTGVLDPPTNIRFGTSFYHEGDLVASSGLDVDCEGFCNPRQYVFAGPRYPFGQQGLTPIDVGADEVGPLVVAGFGDSTRQVDGSRTIPGTLSPPLQGYETGFWLLDAPGLSWPVADDGYQDVWQSNFIDCGAQAPLVLGPMYPGYQYWVPGVNCWYGVHVTGPPTFAFNCTPASWAYKPSILPITAVGDPAAPNTFWTAWARFLPTSANIHPPGMDGCVSFFPDIPPPQDEWTPPTNRLTGGTTFSSTGLWLVGVLRVSPENARRQNAASAVFDQIQTFVVRDSQ